MFQMSPPIPKPETPKLPSEPSGHMTARRVYFVRYVLGLGPMTDDDDILSAYQRKENDRDQRISN